MDNGLLKNKELCDRILELEDDLSKAIELFARLRSEIKQTQKDAREEAKDAYYAGVEQTRKEYDDQY